MGISSFNYNKTLKDCFEKHLFKESEKEKNILNECALLIKDYKKVAGFLRFQSAKQRMIQNISQSYEIKTGYMLEDFFTFLIGSKYINMEKSVKDDDGNETMRFDQFFKSEDGKTVYLIEMKIRDDHDRAKKEGQADDFDKKVKYIFETYKKEKIIAYEWFVDDLYKKNKKYYKDRIDDLRNQLNDKRIEIKDLVYGRQIIDDLFCDVDVWNKFVKEYSLIKNSYEAGFSNIISNYDFDNNNEEYVFNALKECTYVKLEKIFFGEEMIDINAELFPNNILIKKICNYKKKKTKAYKSFEQNLKSRGVI